MEIPLEYNTTQSSKGQRQTWLPRTIASQRQTWLPHTVVSAEAKHGYLLQLPAKTMYNWWRTKLLTQTPPAIEMVEKEK